MLGRRQVLLSHFDKVPQLLEEVVAYVDDDQDGNDKMRPIPVVVGWRDIAP